MGDNNYIPILAFVGLSIILTVIINLFISAFGFSYNDFPHNSYADTITSISDKLDTFYEILSYVPLIGDVAVFFGNFVTSYLSIWSILPDTLFLIIFPLYSVIFIYVLILLAADYIPG